MLDEVKLSLRIKTDAFDEEIKSLIEAAKKDLYNAGIQVQIANPLIKLAIKTYCKINFGENENAEKLQKSYNSLIAKLQIAEGYRRG